MKQTRIKRICALISFLMILITSMMLTSCDEQEIVEKEVLNLPQVLYVEEFDPEMNNIRNAVDSCNIILKVKYKDGMSEDIQLTFDMLEDVFKKELNSEGRHYISYTYKGEEIAVDVLVKSSSSYKVRFYNANNEVISEQTVKKGKAAVEPTEAERAVAGYTFTGWDKSFDSVTSNLDVHGVYEKEAASYTVRFYNANNEVISDQTVK